jgi:hypothetical protein
VDGLHRSNGKNESILAPSGTGSWLNILAITITGTFYVARRRACEKTHAHSRVPSTRLLNLSGLLDEDYSVDRYWLRDGLRATMGGDERVSIDIDVNAEGLSLIAMKVTLSATAPMQMATAIIAPTTSPQVARCSIRGSSGDRVW